MSCLKRDDLLFLKKSDGTPNKMAYDRNSEELRSPGSDQNCSCSSCWHCCLSKNNRQNDGGNDEELNRAHNMSISILYLLCLITGASSLAISFWVQLIDLYWLHVFVICLIGPAFVGYGLFLGCKTSWNEDTQPIKTQTSRRSYIIALIPCSLATIFLDAIRFVLYIEVDRTVIDLVFINCKLFYVAFQVLFLGKYLGQHIKESLSSRLLLMHLIGTNIFLWFHEFSVHSTHSLEFLRHEYSKIYMKKARLTVQIIENSEPYMYPLVIQFMIIASGAAYQIWLNMRSLTAEVHDIYIDDDYNEIRTNAPQVRTFRYITGPITQSELLTTNVETSKKSVPLVSCGLVIGSFVFVGLVLSGLLLLSNRIDRELSLTVYYSYQVAIFSTMTVASWLCLHDMSRDRISLTAMSGLDILILLPMLGYLLYAEFSVVAGISQLFSSLFGTLIFFISLMRVFQVLSQTIVIAKAFRNGLGSSSRNCCSFGPNGLMFLLFTNAALWVTESIFDLRIPFAAPVQCRYYGITLWRSIKFALFPLCVLYRFISCSSLLEILLWSDEY